MPKFNYIAMDAQGKETKGSLDAKNQGEALARLQEMKLFPTKVVEAQQAAAAAARAKQLWEFKMRQYEDSHALRQERTAILGNLVNRFGRFDINVRKERAFGWAKTK